MTTSIVVAIPTFRRPDALRASLEALLPQLGDLDALDDVRASVLVIDNDPGQSGVPTAESLGVACVAESEPGIAAVRNRALAEVSGNDAVIFIDDDEVPEPEWLVRLVRRYLETGADAVAGRVLTVFPDEAEPWVRASGAFIRPVRVDGSIMGEAATNNLLLDIRTVDRLGMRFDARFGLTGGSDSLFTRQFVSRGGIIRWCEEAVVVETEDAVRFTRRWVLMRTFRFGNTWSRVRITLADAGFARLRARATSAGAGIVRIAQGGVGWVVGALTRSLRRARSLRTVYRGAGNVAGAVGYAHDEYGRRRKQMGF